MSSRAVERLLAPLADHLYGSSDHSHASTSTAAGGRKSLPQPRFSGGPSTNSNNNNSTPKEENLFLLRASYDRWMRCFAVWRKVLDSDVVLLALLLHSGCLWAPAYDRVLTARASIEKELCSTSGDSLDEKGAEIYTRVQRREPQAVWALNTLHFLNVIEVVAVTEQPRDSASSAALIASTREREERELVSLANAPKSNSGAGGKRRAMEPAAASRKRRLEDATAGGYMLSEDVLPVPARAGATASSGRPRGGASSVKGAESQPQLDGTLAKGCVVVTNPDEPLVQRVASSLVDEWLELVSVDGNDIVQSTPGAAYLTARDYLLSSALKLAAYVDGTHTALLDENTHVQSLLARQSIASSAAAEVFHKSIPSILQCFLQEETCVSGQPRPLSMPALTFLLPWHTLGKGSRVAVWLPSTDASPHSPVTSSTRGRPAYSSVGRPAAAGRGAAAGGASAASRRGEFLPCEIVSEGMQLYPGGTEDGKGLCMELTWLDEVDSMVDIVSTNRSIINDLVPVCPDARGAHPVRRLWSSVQSLLRGHVRVDVYAPRTLAMRSIPAKDAAADDAQKRKARGQATETATLLYGTYPSEAVSYLSHLFSVNTSSYRSATARHSFQRDALATLLQFLLLSGRRALSLRGLSVSAASPTTATSGASKSGLGKGALVDGGDDMSQNRTVVARGKGNLLQPPKQRQSSTPSFTTAEAELEALCCTAAPLALTALVLAHNLLDSLLEQPQGTLWSVEVASFVCDVALLPSRPVPRLLKDAGYALCLLPNKPQSLLVAVGLFASLGTNQLESLFSPPKYRQDDEQAKGNSDSPDRVHLWWSSFQTHVLQDGAIPAQMYGDIWALAENVDQSMHAAVQHLGGASASTAKRTLKLKGTRPVTAPARLSLCRAATTTTTQQQPPGRGAGRGRGRGRGGGRGGGAAVKRTDAATPALAEDNTVEGQPSSSSPSILNNLVSSLSPGQPEEEPGAERDSVRCVRGTAVVRAEPPLLRVCSATEEQEEALDAASSRSFLFGSAAEHQRQLRAAVASLWVSLEQATVAAHSFSVHSQENNTKEGES